MLSIENPPLDPPSLLQIPNTNNDLDENKASSSSSSSSHNLLALQQEADLLKSSLDETNPVPKFSIRNYVFGSRTKDLSKNWPFSEKNLQLCMKHGVSDPLPPFQTPDSVRRNPFLKRKCSAEKKFLEEEEKICHTDGEISKMHKDEFSLGLCKQNLAASDCPDINSSGSEEIDTDSVPTDTLLESPAEKLEGEEAITHHHQPPVKKCKLIVKLGNKSDPSTSEEILLLPKNFTVSESMASKVCPVCKNFSSSSNTTLNAHIDQCLSGQSTMKWAPNSLVIRYRVKPRKTRLMVDIYATAPYCTLEELERRNGRSWATNSSFQVQEGEFRSEEKVDKVSTVSVEATGNEGDVYIDTDGTKVRILSKFSGVESGSKVGGDDVGAKKILKGEKGNNFVSIRKRKKLHGQKQQKFLKLGKNSLSRRYSEACGGQERKKSMEENRDKVELQTDCFKDEHKQIKKGNSGTMKQWSSSSVTKKSSGGIDEHRYSVHNSKMDSVLETSPSLRNHVLKNPNSSGDPISSPKSSKRMDISAYKPRVGECREQPPFRERKGFSSMGSHASGCGKRVEMNAGPIKNSDASAMRKSSFTHQGFSSKARKLMSLRKNLSSARQDSVAEHKFSFKKKCSSLKKSRVHFVSDLDDDEVVGPSKVSLGRASFFRSGKKRGAIEISRKEETSNLKRSLSPPQRNDDGMKEKTDEFSFGACSDSEATSDDDEFVRKEVEIQTEHIGEGSFMSLNQSLDPEFHKLANNRDAELYEEHPAEPIDGNHHVDEEEMFCSEGQNGHMVAEIVDSRDWQRSYFSDVDAISIPGPPGSFLPSLEDLGSQDFQGNSSLTTSRVQSSEEHQDLVYRDSSDSLVSANSTISNPSLAGSDSRSSENLPVQLPHVQTEIRVPLMENCAPVNAMFPEKRSIGLRNDQPCCCSRKEGASQGGPAFNYQDSQLLRRWTVASVLPPPPAGKQWGSGDPNIRLGISNSRTEMFYPISSGSENGVLYGMKSPAGPNFPMKLSVDSEVKFPINGDSASPSPSVLRLMGKNLMVVNKDQDLPLQQRQQFDDRFSNNFITNVDASTLLHASRIPSKTGGGGSGGGFTATLERHKYEGGIQFAN